jgi:hypothetical protein
MNRDLGKMTLHRWRLEDRGKCGKRGEQARWLDFGDFGQTRQDRVHVAYLFQYLLQSDIMSVRKSPDSGEGVKQAYQGGECVFEADQERFQHSCQFFIRHFIAHSWTKVRSRVKYIQRRDGTTWRIQCD